MLSDIPPLIFAKTRNTIFNNKEKVKSGQIQNTYNNYNHPEKTRFLVSFYRIFLILW